MLSLYNPYNNPTTLRIVGGDYTSRRREDQICKISTPRNIISRRFDDKIPASIVRYTRDHSVNARAIERANWPSFDHRHRQRESFVKCQINFVKFRVTFIYIHGDIG